MENRYKIVISNKNLYREIELAPDAKEVKLGTGADCDVRLRKDLFFGQIELSFVKNNDQWSVLCSDNLYLTVGDVRKLMTKALNHGDELTVKYQESNNDVLSLSFMIDFDNGKKRYEREINISNSNSISIGSNSSSNIVLNSQYVKDDQIELSAVNNGLNLVVKKTAYGVYHNGKKVEGKAIIKSGDFFSVSDYVFYYKEQSIWTEIRTDININGLSFVDHPNKNNYPSFCRNTRIKSVIDSEKIDILDPPAIPEKPKNNIFTKLLPSLGMLVAAGVMAAFGGITMLIFSGVSAIMAIVTSVVSLKDSNKEYKKSSSERIQKYNSYIANKREKIKKLRAEEKQTLETTYVAQDIQMHRFEDFSPALFDRVRVDSDYLCVRLGKGNVEAERKISFKKQEKLEVEDELQVMPEKINDEFKYIQDAPIICDFKLANAVGVVGNENLQFDFLKNLVIDISSRHYFSDVKMFFVAEQKHENCVKWLRMLPHVYSDAIKNRTIVTDDESKNLIFEYLYKELTIREQSKKYDNNIIVFFYDEFGVNHHPISKFVCKAKELGVTFVFFNESKSKLPQGCNYIIDIIDDNNAILIDACDSNCAVKFEYPHINNTQAENVVNLLAPVYTEEISLEGALTKNISMFEMLNILTVDDLDLEKRWDKSLVYKSMAAPIGVSKNGIVYLDLHDKAHGPHGLVAGTTGSGKSEVLQTYILSISTLFNPYEVAFVIIDFKGGGMVNQFKNLPHLLGAITNIDGKEIDRSLKSIKAELQKRQRLFAEADVNHIDKYIKKFKIGEVKEPLPHLIIIVDEFAELKAEQPEFMKELISAARIGRSLGVHLILATQKPSGQVNEQIWSNSRFKLCLKVQSQEDSNEVIKSPLAAEIKEPGRAYMQVGNNEIFELFQSAYSGAPEHLVVDGTKTFKISSLSISGKRMTIYEQKKAKNESDTTQLDAIVNYVCEYCNDRSIVKLPNICLPSLKYNIMCPDEIIYNQGMLSVGIYDDPENQYQGNAKFNFNSENTVIIGASQTGKTNLLQLIIKEISCTSNAGESNMYIMDFGSMILKNFESLRHVGGVVIPAEEEKVKNLFKLLQDELELRKEKLLSAGVSSISSYLEAGNSGMPYLYIILDNFAVFKELYAEKYEDDFLYLLREGITYGISFIVTATSINIFGYRYLSNFANHVCFTCNDASEYSNVFDRCRMEPKNVPGRMLVSFNKAIYEAQSFVAFKGEKEIDRVNNIKEYVSKINEKNLNFIARKIPAVPDELSLQYIGENYRVDTTKEIAIALSYQHVDPIRFDIYATPTLALIGKNLASIMAYEKALISDFKNNYFDRPVDLYIIDSLTRSLSEYADEPFVENYSIDYSRLSNMLESVKEVLETRYNNVLENGLEQLNREHLITIIINNAEAINYISESKELLSLYNSIITKYKSMKVMVVIGEMADENIGFSSPDVLKKVKESKNALIFTNILQHKVFDIPATFIRQNKKPLDNTQAYYLKENEILKLRFGKE